MANFRVSLVSAACVFVVCTGVKVCFYRCSNIQRCSGFPVLPSFYLPVLIMLPFGLQKIFILWVISKSLSLELCYSEVTLEHICFATNYIPWFEVWNSVSVYRVACWLQVSSSEAGQQQEDCRYPLFFCDEDKCLEPEKLCDGTADCMDGKDEVKGFCEK